MGFSLFGGEGLTNDEGARLRRLEAKLDLVMAHLGLEYDETVSAELTPKEINLINQGNKILAIRNYRERTGIGLKEAKQAIEAYQCG